MLGVGCFSPLAAGCSPPSLATLGAGEWIITAAAAVTAIGAILAFIRREANQHEPAPERRVTGGPVEVALLKRCVERHEHDDLKATVARQRAETWEVVNGLRCSVSKIEADIAGLRAQREANGERLTELSGDIKGLSKLVHRLAGIVETKLEGAKD
jgi:hypothetical protein